MYDNYLRDIERVIAGEKPLVIISMGKCDCAGEFDALRRKLREYDLYWRFCVARCEDGKDWPHMIAGPSTNDALDLLDSIRSGKHAYRRENLQRAFGCLLGYEIKEVEEFVGSQVARECPCDWCGRDYA